jgi:hypothetical protein
MSQVTPRPGIPEAAGIVESHIHTHSTVTFQRKAKISLLRISAVERLAGVLLLLCGLWTLVFWALH